MSEGVGVYTVELSLGSKCMNMYLHQVQNVLYSEVGESVLVCSSAD